MKKGEGITFKNHGGADIRLLQVQYVSYNPTLDEVYYDVIDANYPFESLEISFNAFIDYLLSIGFKEV